MIELIALAPALCLLECLYFLYALHVKPRAGEKAEAFERLTWAFASLLLAGAFVSMEAVYAAISGVYPIPWSAALNSTAKLARRLRGSAAFQVAEYARWAAYLGAVAGVIEGVQAALVIASVATGGFSLALWLKLQAVKSTLAALQAIALLGVRMASTAYATSVIIAVVCGLMAVATPYMVLGGLALMPSHGLRPLAKALVVFGLAFGVVWPWAVGTLAGSIGLKSPPPAPRGEIGLLVLEAWVNVSGLDAAGLPPLRGAEAVSNVTVGDVVSEELPGPPGVALAYRDLETGRLVVRVVPGSVARYTGRPPRRVLLELSGRYEPLFLIYSYVKMPVEVYWEYRNATYVFESGRGSFPVRPLEGLSTLELNSEIPPGVNYTLVRLYPRCSPGECILVFRGETGVGWLRYGPGWAVKLHSDYSNVSGQYVELWGVLDPGIPGIEAVNGTSYARVSYVDGVVRVELSSWEWSIKVPGAPSNVTIEIEGREVSLNLGESASIPVNYTEVKVWAYGLVASAQPVTNGVSRLQVSVGGTPYLLQLRARCRCERSPSGASPALNFTRAFLGFTEMVSHYYAGRGGLVQVGVRGWNATIRLNETLWRGYGVGLESSALHIYRGDLVWSHAFTPHRIVCSAKYYGEPLRPAVAYAQANGWPYLPGNAFVKALPGGLVVDGVAYMYNESAWIWLEADPLWRLLAPNSTDTAPLLDALRDHAKIFNLSILLLLATAATFAAADLVSGLIGGVSISGRLGLRGLASSRQYTVVASALSAAMSAITAVTFRVKPPTPQRPPPVLMAWLGLDKPPLRVARAGWSARVRRLRRGVRRLAEAYYKAVPFTKRHPLPAALRAAAALAERLSVGGGSARAILRPRLYALSKQLRALSTLASMRPPELAATAALAASKALIAVAERLAELRRAGLEELALRVRGQLPPELRGLEARPWILRAVAEARGLRVKGLAKLERAEEEACRLADVHAYHAAMSALSWASEELWSLSAFRLGSLAGKALSGPDSYLAVRASEEEVRRALTGRAVSDVLDALAETPLYGPLLRGAASSSRAVAVGIDGVMLDPKEVGRIKQALQQLKPLDPVPRGLEPLYLRGLALGLRAWAHRITIREGKDVRELEPGELEERYGYVLEGFSSFELANRALTGEEAPAGLEEARIHELGAEREARRLRIKLRELLGSRISWLAKLEAALEDLEAILKELEECGVELAWGTEGGFAVKLRLRQASQDLEGKVVEALGALERAEDLALRLLANGEEALRILKSMGGGALMEELSAEVTRLTRLLSELRILRSELEGLLDELEGLAQPQSP